jgi:hypothetical protein
VINNNKNNNNNNNKKKESASYNNNNNNNKNKNTPAIKSRSVNNLATNFIPIMVKRSLALTCSVLH